MKLEIAREIVAAGSHLGLDMRLRKDYSGRGMFGEKTAAVVTTSRDTFDYAVDHLAFILDYLASNPKLNATQVQAEAKAARHDSMGHDIIVY